MSNKILVVDDEESIRWVLSTSLEKEGYIVDIGENGREAIDKAVKNPYALMILDIKMPDISGLEVLSNLKERELELPIILITAQNTVNNAIKGIKLGAYDYIAKPFDLDEVNKVVNRAIENTRKSRKYGKQKKDSTISEEDINLGVIVGKSPEMLNIYKTVGRVADKDITVLLTGESGTGKELVTRAIHSNSLRNNNKLVSINITAIPKELIESELFGHEKGAFTGAQALKIGRFEEADGGTLHIDEIGEMSQDLQTKLLRVLEENTLYRLGSETPIEVDVRVVASTNRDLLSEVEKGNFRQDLFYRLNAITIDLPPLRERKEDIPILTEYFKNKYSEEFNLGTKIFDEEVASKFLEYLWPGNVRELENTVKRLLLLTPDNVINLRHLKEEVPHIASGAVAFNAAEQSVKDMINKYMSEINESSEGFYGEIISRIEKQLFKIVLEKTGGNKKKAATMLGINRNTLAKKLSELDLN